VAHKFKNKSNLKRTLVKLGNASVSVVENNRVNALALMDVTVTQNAVSDAWDREHCFELFVGSPYSEPAYYQTFSEENPVTCEVSILHK
jgi:hypothetical protein